VKAAITGYGNADKEQVGAMVTRLLRLDAPPKPADAADALALAICHVWRGGAQARIEAAVAAGCDYIATETGFPLTADEPSPSYHNMLWAGFRPLSIRDNYAPKGTRWDHEGALVAVR